MEKVVFLGSDVHGPPVELATKTIQRLVKGAKKYKIISIQEVQKLRFTKNIWTIPNISPIRFFRLVFNALVLPIYLTILRIFGYNKLATFWTASTRYHYFLFLYLRLIGYRIFFTVISGYDKDYSHLRWCNVIICQSKKMKDKIKEIFPEKKIVFISPGVDLKVFKPRKKKNMIVIPSVPHKLTNVDDRNTRKLVSFLERENIQFKIITRTKEVGEYFNSLDLKNGEVISKVLTDKQLASILSEAKVMPLYYEKASPDSPLSAIEGLACGCAIICSKNLEGLRELVEKKTGIVSNRMKKTDFLKIFKDNSYNLNARKLAVKSFDLRKTTEKYQNLMSD